MGRARGVFVTATDTDVGKTVVTAALGHALTAAGHTVSVFKPVQSGFARADPDGDTMRLCRWLELDAEPGEINLHAFEEPLAPLVAARRARREIQLSPIVERAAKLGESTDVLLVEGAGGLLVPVGEAWTIADLALALGYPLVVVARATLGTVNHTLLTVRVARSLGLHVAAVILNCASKTGEAAGEAGDEDTGPADASIETNGELIAELGEVRVLGPLPWLGERFDGVTIRERLAPLLDTGPLIEPDQSLR